MRILLPSAALLLGLAAGGALAQAPSRPLPPPPPPAPPALVASAEPVAEPVRQRRVRVAELGHAAGLEFGAEGRELVVPLPRSADGSARLALSFDLVAPFAARRAVEVRANGRLLAAPAFPDGTMRLSLELPLDVADHARGDGELRLGLRLLEQPGPALGAATLRPESYLALTLPAETALGIRAVLRLMPARVLILTRPGPLPVREAAAALHAALALARRGREVRIVAGAAPELRRDEDGALLWDTGAVVIGATPDALAVVELAGVPLLAIGGPEPDAAARLLDGPWAEAMDAARLAVARAGPPAEAAGALPFSALPGRLEPQETARASWVLQFSMRDLPPRSRPAALDAELRASAESGRAVASVLLNGALLVTAAVPADGVLRLDTALPEALLRLENRIEVALHRGTIGSPAQLLPGGRIRLAPAGPPIGFVDLPAALAAGYELILDLPGGAVSAESLALPLWLLRAVAPAAAPITVTPNEPGAAPQPAGPFVALTHEPPSGTAPRLRVEGGRLRLAGAEGAPVTEVDRAGVLAVQLLQAAERPGLWLAAPTAFAPDGPPPAFGRDDAALLDRHGVALALPRDAPVLPVAAPPASVPAMEPVPAADDRPGLFVWRPWVVGFLWLVGVGLVGYALARPRGGPGAGVPSTEAGL